ncbi:OTU deubiquitinase with linear linkage specificity b isoform X2 [Trichomycterus rosablanca]|uniref:OTU deubiquitinase with linear linkage specificity b isoform X2 n=1 Tax=Trichomycterus rosablanca TaxID=2290929 RepID=UPI002F35DF5E
MHSTNKGNKDAHSRKTNKAKSTRESVNERPVGGDCCSQSKKSKKAQRPTLNNRCQSVQAAASKQKACQPEHEKSREMTSRMQSVPEDKARSSNQDSRLLPQIPAGIFAAEDDNSELDLYRAEEEIEQEQQEKHRLKPASSEACVEDKNSVAAPENLLSYSEREWRGNTSKSRLIKKGYEAIAQKFEGLRRVRGDNYCALRATLFQLLSQSNKLPAWLQDPELIKGPSRVPCVQDLVDQWRFPFGSYNNKSAVEQLKHCLELLRNRWQEAAECKTSAEQERLCQRVFVGDSEEYDMLEALKFLMLTTAVQLHSDMQNDSSVPEFCWLLFARDTSKCPRSFLTNHLRHVGFTGGLEQVEMFLLGYTLQQTLQVYRLYKTDTEEFITYYPDDHRSDWPQLCLVTEDDRHYNVPVPKPQSLTSDKSGGPRWNKPTCGSKPADSTYV